ncbi:GIY-YIG nuclease family protein [Rhodococcus sp. NPDC058521]|uniref:GIY-YIG nuclease family protein n=1 Tax=Rhodococcus sp. NPDC058521 TaxID=3346536 RepID=UPI003655FB87
MATVWTVPLDILPRWLDSAEVQAFLSSNDQPNASADPKIRLAQFADVTKSLQRHVGETYTSVQAASTALFDGIGDGLGVPVGLKLAALRLVVTPVHLTRPSPQPLPDTVTAELGRYVFALLDPRSRRVFHVGSGTGNRVFGHVWAALEENEKRQVLTDPETDSAEVRETVISRIRDIYDSGHEVEHYVVAHDIEDSGSAADRVNVLVAGFGLLESGDRPTLTNLLGTVDEKAVRIEDLALQYSAERVPTLPTPCLLLEVKHAGERRASPESIYAAAREDWPAGTAVRGTADLPVIVFADNIVRAVYRAKSWDIASRSADTPLWRFTGDVDADLEAQFVNKRVTPDRVGLKRWPAHGWAPHLTHARPGR